MKSVVEEVGLEIPAIYALKTKGLALLNQSIAACTRHLQISAMIQIGLPRDIYIYIYT